MVQAIRMSDILADADNPQSKFVTRNEVLGMSGIGLSMLKDNPPGYYPDPANTDYTLQLITRGSGTGRLELGAGSMTGRQKVGDMVFAASNTRTEYEIDFAFDLAIVALPGDLLEQAHAAFGKPGDLNTEPLHKTILRDPLVEQLILDLHRETADGNPGGPIYADSAAHLLAATILRLGERINLPANPTRPLRDAELSRVDAYVEDHLGEQIRLSDLAAQVGLDVYHFSRAFRAATGSAPHAHVIARRVERAQDLLASSDEELAAIAFDCGFASQSHLTSTFKSHVGVPPGAYRRSLRA